MPSNKYKKIIYREKIRLAKIGGGDYRFNVTRPNYAQVDNTGVLISPSCLMYIEPESDQHSSDRISGAIYFNITGDANLFDIGDIITPVADPNDLPVVTVVEKPDEQEYLAVRSDYVGTITDGAFGNIYLNVAFAYVSNPQGGQAFFFEQSMDKPSKKVIIFPRSGIKEKMSFTDVATGDIWNIAVVEYYNNGMVLHLDSLNRI